MSGMDSVFELKQYMRDVHFRRVIGVGAMEAYNSASRTALGFGEAIQLSDSATEDCRFSFPRPDLWRNGELEFTLLYSGDTSSTNNIRIQLDGACIANGGDLTPAAATDTVTEDLPGPAAAELLKKNTFATTLTVTADAELIQYQISRIGGHTNDNYVGEAYILGAVVDYQPNNL